MAVEKAASEKAAAALVAFDLSEIKQLIARWNQGATYRIGINFMPRNFLAMMRPFPCWGGLGA